MKAPPTPGPARGRRQRGAVAIMFGLTVAVLIGFAGLAIDLGRFFVIKSEYQNAVDACALAAASQLRPGQNNPSALTRAVAYGRVFSTGGVDDPATAPLEGNIQAIKNMANFQGTVVDIAADQIKFSNTLGGPYETSASANYNTAAFARCSYSRDDLPIFFMKVFNASLTTQTVSATAAATLAPSSSSCAIPASLCNEGAGPNFGHTVGQWIPFGDKLGFGNFGWVDFTPKEGGAEEVRDLLKGSGYCTAKIGDTVNESGNKVGAYDGWNSRFGLYKGSVKLAEAPPDVTGYAYYGPPASSNSENTVTWALGKDAYAGSSGASKNYLTASAENLPYQFKPDLTAAQHKSLGRNKRVTVAAIVNGCGSKSLTIAGWACVLMLNPVLKNSDTAKLEFLGLSTNPGSPCSTNGEPGTFGPLVPQLVQ